MVRNANIPVIHYESERVPDDRPGAGPGAAENFFEVRQAVVSACRRHGPTGPDDSAFGFDYDDYVYWIIDDQYNEERYQYAEIPKPKGMTKAWLDDLMAALRAHPFWGVGIQFIDGYMLVFEDRLMVNGARFSACTNFDGVLKCARTALKLHRQASDCKDDESLEKLSRVRGVAKAPVHLMNLERVTNKGMRFVSRLAGLVTLNLYKGRVTDRGLVCLANLTGLRWLSLHSRRVGDKGMKHLSHLTNLEDLDLSDTNVTDLGLVYLTQLHELRALSLPADRVTKRGIGRLRKALPRCTIEIKEAGSRHPHIRRA